MQPRPRSCGAALAIVLVTLTGCSAAKPPTSPASSSRLTISGVGEFGSSITIGSAKGLGNGGDDPTGVECWGVDSDAQFRAGLPISVTDESGKVIGIGKLQAGTYGDAGAWWECYFPFEVSQLPRATFYGLQFGENPVIRLTPEEASSELAIDFNQWRLSAE